MVEHQLGSADQRGVAPEDGGNDMQWPSVACDDHRPCRVFNFIGSKLMDAS